MTSISQPASTPPVRISSLADLLAGLPVLFGFRPDRSLIVLSLEGARGAVGFRLRVDLPSAGLGDQAADYLAAVLRRNGAGRVVVIACSDDPAVADPVVLAVTERLLADGVEVHDAVRCDGGRYWSYVCDSPACCPPEGRPYDASSSRLVAEAVLSGMEILPDRAALAARVAPVAGADLERMEKATADGVASMFGVLGERDPAALATDPAVREAGTRRVRDIVDASLADPDRSLTDAEAAALSVWCSIAAVRETALSSIDVDNAAEQLRIWSQVTRKVVPPYELPVLALTGFSAWLSGDGALAWCVIERADRIAGHDRLVELLRRILVEAMPPSAWAPPTDERLRAVVDPT